MRSQVLAILIASLSAGPALAGSGAKGPAAVALTPLPVRAPGIGFQIVRGDAKGRVKLLTEDLELFSLTTSNALETDGHLKTDAALGRPFQPALSADGSSWLATTRGGGVIEFDGTKGVPLPPPPLPPMVLTFLGSEPAIGFSLDPGRRSFLKPNYGGDTPYLLRLSGSDWEAVLTSSGSQRDEIEDFLETSLLAAPDTKYGRLWVAKECVFDVRKLSATGRELLKVTRPRLRAAAQSDPERQAAFQQELEKKDVQPGRVTSVVSIPEALVRALAVWSGDAYLLVAESDGDSYALYRVTGDTGEVARAGIEAERLGRILSMAARNEGLVLAGARATHGLWSVGWAALEPQWRPVPEKPSEVSPAPAGR